MICDSGIWTRAWADLSSICLFTAAWIWADFLAAGREKTGRGQKIRRELGLAETDFVAGYVAALEWRKGHHYVIELARRLCPDHPRLRFLFAGEGFDRERLQALAREAGVAERILFTGYRTDVPDVMAALDIKLFASEREGLPQVLVQAAAVGLPVLAFEAEGVRELVHEGKNGHVFGQGDVAGMARALTELMEQPQRRRRMSEYGPGLVDERWTIETMQAKTVALYDELLRERGLR